MRATQQRIKTAHTDKVAYLFEAGEGIAAFAGAAVFVATLDDGGRRIGITGDCHVDFPLGHKYCRFVDQLLFELDRFYLLDHVSRTAFALLREYFPHKFPIFVPRG
jgi:hypothetical protein